MLEEEAGRWFVNGGVSPYMLFVFDVVSEKAARIPAVRHVDGTARIQTVNRAQNPLYYDLIRAFAARTDVPVLVNTSDDTVPTPGWLCFGVSAVENGAVVAWGRIVTPIPDPPTDYELDAVGLEHAEFVTANCFVKRSALEAIGGFDERFKLAWREDADLFFRLLKYGQAIEYASQAVVVHLVRPAPWGISIMQQYRVLFDALLYKKHPNLYRCKIRPTPPWKYYAIITALSVSLVAAFAGQESLTIAASLVWLGLPAALCSSGCATLPMPLDILRRWS